MVYLKTGNATGSKEFSRRAAGKNFSPICNIPPPWVVFYVKGGADMKQTEAPERQGRMTPERQGRMTPEGLARSYERNVDTVWNVCITFLKNPADAEDAVQETFLRLMRSAPELGSETHEKAWLIVTARNVCKNELARARRREVPLEEAEAHYVPELSDTLLALRSLPEKYRLPLYLYYYEGYSTAETAELLGKPAATVRSDLRRGRERMKALLGGDF
jgi:RNA polymerase sigma factor (sigma-70 family)